MDKLQLPIGIQDFRVIREDDEYYYVDKTELIRRLVGQGRHYFLSRPRRFGKSLLIDTLKSLFEGREELFRGLDIHPHWDWSVSHPVVRLSFGRLYNEPEDIERSILRQLSTIERNAGLEPGSELDAGPERLQDLLDRLHRAAGRQAVVLVDEYDKPVLDVLEDPKQAKKNRDYLRGIYGIVKDSAEHVRFVFVTGVSMFTKVSLFSEMNYLDDISLDPQYATICGYTDGDLDTVFAPELPGLERDEIRRWYNGYHWLGAEKVYNPFDVLLLFRKRKFDAHWFRTGSPTFLYRMLVEQKVNPMELERRMADTTLVSKFDVDDIDIDALMFQSGYLTIADETWDGTETTYTLEYPNYEVCWSLNRGLLGHVTRRVTDAVECGRELADLLSTNDFDGFGAKLQAYLSGVPHQWYDASEIERYEAHYAGMLYMALRAIGVDIRVEDSSSRGRADLAVLHGGQVFVLEFKMAGGEGESAAAAALDEAKAQMKERGYADKYRDRNEPIHLIGLAFASTERNLVGARAEAA